MKRTLSREGRVGPKVDRDTNRPASTSSMAGGIFHPLPFVFHPVIRLYCNEAVGEEEDNYVFKMSSAPLWKAPVFSLRGCGRCCLEMAQIAPQRALMRLSTDCLV